MAEDNLKTIKIKFLDPQSKVKAPVYKTSGSSGCDLYASQDATIKAGSVAMIKTGISIELPKGYEAQVRSRSGLALKQQVFVLNSPGTIDNDYRGEVCVILANFSNTDFNVKVGDRIAQMVVCQYEQFKFDEIPNIEELSVTERGSGGFGSTGTK